MDFLSRNSKKISLVVASILSAAFLAIVIKSVLTSHDAQAPIAFLFLPIYTGLFFVVCWGTVWSIIEIRRSLVYRSVLTAWKKRCVIASLVLVGCVAVVVPVVISEYMYKTSESSYSSPNLLKNIYNHRTTALKDSIVMMNLAGNIRCPSDILGKLASENNSAVRYRVAANPNTSIDTLTALASDSELYVRMHLSSNTSTPLELMYKLRNDSDPSVREKALYFSQQRGLVP